MNTHTPGPWKVAGSCNVGHATDGSYYHIAHVCVANDNDRNPLIADVSSRGIYGTEQEALKPSDEQLANAKLIAAAPDLLAACEAATHDQQTEDGWTAQMLAAIAKAKGERGDK